jgi:hypothetical protein
MTKAELVFDTSVYLPIDHLVRLLAREYLIGYFALFQYMRMRSMGQAIYMEGKGKPERKIALRAWT